MVLKTLDFAMITNHIARILFNKGYGSELRSLGEMGVQAILSRGGLFGRCMLTMEQTTPFLVSGQLQFLATELHLHGLTNMKDGHDLWEPISEPIIVMHPLAEALNNGPKFHLNLDEEIEN